MIARINQIAYYAMCFLKNRRANTAIEYALIASLIAMAIIGAVTMLGGSLSNSFDNTADSLQNV